MLLNTARFSEYADKFNKCMSILGEYWNMPERIVYINGVACRDIDQVIYNIFPKDWIIYGTYYDQSCGDFVEKYHNICELSYTNLKSLQLSINNIIAMLDNSIQTLADFDKTYLDLGDGL